MITLSLCPLRKIQFIKILFAFAIFFQILFEFTLKAYPANLPYNTVNNVSIIKNTAKLLSQYAGQMTPGRLFGKTKGVLFNR